MKRGSRECRKRSQELESEIGWRNHYFLAVISENDENGAGLLDTALGEKFDGRFGRDIDSNAAPHQQKGYESRDVQENSRDDEGSRSPWGSGNGEKGSPGVTIGVRLQ